LHHTYCCGGSQSARSAQQRQPHQSQLPVIEQAVQRVSHTPQQHVPHVLRSSGYAQFRRKLSRPAAGATVRCRIRSSHLGHVGLRELWIQCRRTIAGPAAACSLFDSQMPCANSSHLGHISLCELWIQCRHTLSHIAAACSSFQRTTAAYKLAVQAHTFTYCSCLQRVQQTTAMYKLAAPWTCRPA
jgi:hypothetical protein